MQSRGMAFGIVVGLILGMATGLAAGERSPEALVAVALGEEVAAEEREAAIEALLAHGDAAAEAIGAAWRDPDAPARKPIPLIEALARIESEGGVRTLRDIIAPSLLLPSDFPDREALVTALFVANPEEAEPSPVVRIWALLPPDVREILRNRAETLARGSKANAGGADAEGAEQPPALTDDEAARLAMSFNVLLNDEYLYDEAAFAGTPLPDEARGFLALHNPDTDRLHADAGLNPFELRRLNRLLIHAAAPGAIPPGRPFMLERYSPRLERAALAALAANPHPRAREFLLAYRPVGIPGEMNHLRTLARLEDDRAAWTIGAHLLSPDSALGGMALRGVLRRRDTSAAEDAVEEAWERAERGGTDAYEADAIERVLRAAAALADPGEAADILADALDEDEFRDAALGVVSRSAVLLAERDVLGEVLDAVARRNPPDEEPLENELSEAQLLALLEGVERYTVRAALPVVALCLESRYADVRMRACDLMGALTEADFGRNPVAWLAWYREERR